MFRCLTTTLKKPLDPLIVRMRCVCGSEFSAAEAKECAACGRKVPAAISVDGGPWKSYVECKIETLNELLRSDALNDIPAEARQTVREHLEQTLRQLEDGSWKEEARRMIATYRKMQDPRLQKHMQAEDHEKFQISIESAIQKLQQELEAGGESP